MGEGSLGLAVAVAALLVGGVLLESLWIKWAWESYFRLSLPLGADLVPLRETPELTEGRTSALGFTQVRPGVLVFWADRDARAAPTLLHGIIDLQPSHLGCALRVRWAPPWTPILAAVWLVGLGIARGEAQITVPIGFAMMCAMAILYLRGARQAATELRWALAHGGAEADQ